MKKLGVNIDHVATVRQARGIEYPSPLEAARLCTKAGAHSIVCHLREDRRHIQDRDVAILRRHISFLNLEMALHPSVIDVALRIRPDEVTIVPEKRKELTTEGGLDVEKNFGRLKKACAQFRKKNIRISLFIDPSRDSLTLAKELKVGTVELHTGLYCDARREKDARARLEDLKKMASYGNTLGLHISAGHGLNYDNVVAVAAIREIEWFNIGHSIVARAIMVGMTQAVREMLALLRKSR
jgi:pyridoxine 5-phosphate synthase